MEESLKMSRFKHAHVMGLTGVCMDTGSTPFIIMPYMANGSLLKYLKKERETLVIHEETNVDEDEVNIGGTYSLLMSALDRTFSLLVLTPKHNIL